MQQKHSNKIEADLKKQMTAISRESVVSWLVVFLYFPVSFISVLSQKKKKKKKKKKLNTDLPFFIFQLSEKKNDPNIHTFLTTLDPDFVYFPNDRKCWIIAKAAKVESVREAFKDTSINVTVQGQKNLGAARIKEVFRETCQRKGDQLDQWHSSVGRIWSILTTSVLRSLHLWLETSVHVLFKNFAGHSRSITAIRKCNISVCSFLRLLSASVISWMGIF